MSDPIPLDRHRLTHGRLLLDVGHSVDAGGLLGGLDRPDLPADTRAEVHRLFGEIAFNVGRFRVARRRFRAAIRLEPSVAENYASFALAVASDPDASPILAWKALRRAVRLNPREPRYWAALGQAALRLGKRRSARLAFRQAVLRRPDRLITLAEIVDGFLALNCIGDARELVTELRFRYPNDPAVAGLWNQFRYAVARREQQARRDRPDATILPFPGRDSESTNPMPGVIRTDCFSQGRPHLLRLAEFDRRR